MSASSSASQSPKPESTWRQPWLAAALTFLLAVPLFALLLRINLSTLLANQALPPVLQAIELSLVTSIYSKVKRSFNM